MVHFQIRKSPPTRIEMKMMSSMPSTISSAVRVTRAIQTSGLVSQSDIGRKRNPYELKNIDVFSR
jgi:hypothetical protein